MQMCGSSDVHGLYRPTAEVFVNTQLQSTQTFVFFTLLITFLIDTAPLEHQPDPFQSGGVRENYF